MGLPQVFGLSASGMLAKFDAIDTDGSGKLSKEELKAELMNDRMFANNPDKEVRTRDDTETT